MKPSLELYLGLGAVLFSLGLYGALTRRHIIGILISLELMLNACNLNLVAFNKFVAPWDLSGHVFAIFVITVAACEAVVGLALVYAVYKEHGTLYIEKINILKW